MGDDKVDQFFYGGHSLGGATVSSYVQETADNAIATFAWGAYSSIAIEDPALNYKTPYMTVGAELDGGAGRITRTAQSFDSMNNSEIDPKEARYTYPVVVIEGMNHADFLSGSPPDAVKKMDIRSMISTEESIDHIS